MGDTPEQSQPMPQPASDRNLHRCTGCGAGLRPDQTACVYCGTRCSPATSPVGPAQPLQSPAQDPVSVPDTALCRSCGYALAGLQVSDVCPECGRPVLDSIRGDFLYYCDTAYLQSLHRGVVLVQTGLILHLFASVFGVGMGALAGTGFGIAAQSIGALAGLVPATVSLVGWLTISIPDPGVSLEDKGDAPRKRLRVSVIVNTAAALCAGVIGAISPGSLNFATGSGATALPSTTIFQSLAGVATVAAYIAFVVQFFAAMKYLHWLAPRIPNPELERTMTKQTWTIALLYFPGCVLCIGPLISLILFYNLLDKFRNDFKRIRIATYGNAGLWGEFLPGGPSTPSGPQPPAQPPNSGGTN